MLVLSLVSSRQMYNEEGALFDGLVLFFFFPSRREIILLQGEEPLHINFLHRTTLSATLEPAAIVGWPSHAGHHLLQKTLKNQAANPALLPLLTFCSCLPAIGGFCTPAGCGTSPGRPPIRARSSQDQADAPTKGDEAPLLHGA